MMEELRTLVIYDIEDDRIRLKISETCLDYGLVRIQFSAFLGTLESEQTGGAVSEGFRRSSVITRGRSCSSPSATKT